MGFITSRKDYPPIKRGDTILTPDQKMRWTQEDRKRSSMRVNSARRAELDRKD